MRGPDEKDATGQVSAAPVPDEHLRRAIVESAFADLIVKLRGLAAYYRGASSSPETDPVQRAIYHHKARGVNEAIAIAEDVQKKGSSKP